MSLTVANLRRALEDAPLTPGGITYIPRDQEWVRPPIFTGAGLRRGYFDAAVCGLVLALVALAIVSWSIGL